MDREQPPTAKKLFESNTKSCKVGVNYEFCTARTQEGIVDWIKKYEDSSSRWM